MVSTVIVTIIIPLILAVVGAEMYWKFYLGVK